MIESGCRDYAVLIAMYLFAIIFGIMFLTLIVEVVAIVWERIDEFYFNKRINKRILSSNNSNSICNNRNNNNANSVVGTDNSTINSRQNMESDRCYEKGEITNLCAIIALKTILREYRSLSNIEKDAINKGVDSIISMEKLNNYINNENSIDIEDYI